MDMASMADIRFAADSARFGMAYVKMGIVPGDGGAYFLPRIVGLQKALELIWTGDPLTLRRLSGSGTC
jgi:2-(1,2-epoxy-1,2-dihydrophenyl)acetyl-CoA isomerase